MKLKKLEEVVKLQGWVHKLRKLGKIAFVLLRDRTGIIQCVVDAKKIDVKELKLESVVEIEGIVKENEGRF
ncbi:OB-fold nucleic acid binding domain-containing protein, partial [Escherichia coli]|nr:OB-fold nucleic acid binding domain-containing protein [Escherichia coli]